MNTTIDVLDHIRAHGRAAYPDEGCGFLLGTCADGEVHVTAARRAGNRHPEGRARRYLIGPDDFRDAARDAAERGLEVVGFYHSHPDHPARPSETDLKEATFPGYVYIIVSIKNGASAELTAWTLAPDRSRFDEEAITRDGAFSREGDHEGREGDHEGRPYSVISLQR